MANSKQKPVPEGAKRSPGRSKFSLPRKEVPPIDGSYLERLFADFKSQSEAIQNQEVTSVLPEESGEIQNEPAAAIQPLEVSSAELADIEVSQENTVRADVESHELVPFPRVELVDRPAETQTAASPAPETTPSPEPDAPAPSPVRPPRKRPPAPATQNALIDDSDLLDKWKKKHRLSKGEFKVLKALLSLCRECGGDSCFIKIPQLMEAAELRERQTQLVLKSLREFGLIHKIAEYSNADRLGTHYRLNLDAE